MATSREQAKTFYRGALTALSFLEERRPTGRRFGQDADLTWASLRGHLMDIDRVDLRVRDADAQWPGSLGPRQWHSPMPDNDTTFYEAYAAILDTELRAHALTPDDLRAWRPLEKTKRRKK